MPCLLSSLCIELLGPCGCRLLSNHSKFRVQEMADGQQPAPCFAATFFTDDIDDASVVSTFSASSNGQLERTAAAGTGETAAIAGFQGLLLSAEHTCIWRLGH